MVELECYISEAHEVLVSGSSTRKDYLHVFEKLCMQYAEMITVARHNNPLNAKKLIRIIVLLDLLRTKLS